MGGRVSAVLLASLVLVGVVSAQIGRPERVVGSCTEDIDGSREACRTGECEMGNLICDAVLRVGTTFWNADLAMINGGGIRNSLEEGDINNAQILSVLPFLDDVVIFNLQGSQLHEQVEHGLAVLGTDGELDIGSFLQFSTNVDVIFDANGPERGSFLPGKLRFFAVNGEPIYPFGFTTTKYRMMANSFIFGGGDGFTFAENALNVVPRLKNTYTKLLKIWIRMFSPITPAPSGHILDGQMTVGETTAEAGADSDTCRTGECAMGNIVCEAALESLGEEVDLVMENAGALRAPLPAGDVSLSDIVDASPFGNFPIVFKISAKDLRTQVENGLSDIGEGRFPQFSKNVKLVFDPTKEVGSRIVSLMIDGVTVPKMGTKIFTMAVNNFIFFAGNSDGYTFSEVATEVTSYVGDRDLYYHKMMYEYLMANSPVDPALTGHIGERVLGITDVMIDGSMETCRTQECGMGNLVCEAILSVSTGLGAVFTLENGGSFGGSFDIGDVTNAEIVKALPFENHPVVFTLLGSELLTELENGLSKIGIIEVALDGRFPQMSLNVDMLYDVTMAPYSRIKFVAINGVALVMDKRYRMATNDYLYNGGDEYTFKDVARNPIVLNRQHRKVLGAYLRNNSPIGEGILNEHIVEGSMVIGSSGSEYDYVSCSGGPCDLGTIVADAAVAATGAQLCIENGGAQRDGIPAGDVTLNECFDVRPFGNNPVTFDISGSDLQMQVWAGILTGEGAFPQLSSNVSYTYDSGGITSFMIDGAPIDPEAVYTVCTNSFLYNGGDGYSFLDVASNVTTMTGTYYYSILADYIAANPV